MGVGQSRTRQAGSRALTREDRLIDGDDEVTQSRFGGPPGDPGTLESGPHLCALYQDQGERRRLTAAVVRGALAAGDWVMCMAHRLAAADLPGRGRPARITLANATEPVRRVLDLGGFRARAVVIES